MSNLTTLQKKAITCIVFISFVQMATNGIASILGRIIESFPEVSASTVQFLMTFPCLFVVVTTLLASRLLTYCSKKKLIEFGLLLVCLAGIISFFGSSSLAVLFIGAAVLGCGVGFVASFAISLISDYFEEEKRGTMMGLQTAASNLGSMLMTFFGGILAVSGWKYTYFVYLIALPGFVLSHIWLKDDRTTSTQKSVSFFSCKYALRICLVIMLFMFFFYIGPTSVALVLAEKGYTNTSLAGTGTTLLLLGGVLTSLLFSRIDQKLNSFCIPAGFLLLCIGFFLMQKSNQLLLLYIGCMFAGASLSLVMPKCMLLISMNEEPHRISTATAMAMAISNIGTLIAPVFTVLCSVFFRIETAQGRLLAASGLCLIIAFTGILVVRKGEK